MKTFTSLVPISFALLTVGSPLGNRAVFQRHNGTPYVNARRYILQSRLDSPAACVALAPSNTTTVPDLGNSTVPITNSTTNDDVPPTDNSTVVDPLSINNTTTPDNSTSPANSTTQIRRSESVRFWGRFAQDDLPAVAQSWQDLCLVSGGDIFTDEPCVNLAGVNGINALLADADPCAQQDNADAMIAFARSPGVNNTDQLIANAVSYRQHPRNAMNILGVVPSTLYCDRAPQSPELVGIVNSQLDDVDPGLFGSPNIPIRPFGTPGTCPFGQTPDVTTCTCVDGAGSAANGTTTASTDASATGTESASDNAASTTSVASVGTGTVTDIPTPSVTADASSPTSTDVAISQATTTTPADTPVSTTVSVDPVTTTRIDGPSFQPGDISGDVNDPNGR